ncbi:MAG: helix-turn-helix domain-containing protein [Holosporaceae bacterium]|jgi:transcriptional regulator with XRE-family HTH domain|nr:helix-turn-helix domain-containing protein [Holosporaceae bacterium]
MTDYSELETKSSQDSIDLHIGKQVKARRFFLGISQEKLGNYLGVTFQQIQKYEKGTNRISAGTLYNIANILDVDTSYFYSGYQQTQSLNEESGLVYNPNQSKNKETSELLRFFYKITDATIRKKVLALIKSIASAQKE